MQNIGAVQESLTVGSNQQTLKARLKRRVFNRFLKSTKSGNIRSLIHCHQHQSSYRLLNFSTWFCQFLITKAHQVLQWLTVTKKQTWIQNCKQDKIKEQPAENCLLLGGFPCCRQTRTPSNTKQLSPLPSYQKPAQTVWVFSYNTPTLQTITQTHNSKPSLSLARRG